MTHIKKLLREPLIHFLLLGAGLFLVFRLVGDRPSGQAGQIVITVGHIERLVEGWTRTWQRPPTSDELDGLIEDYIQEEIFYREALALGLDGDDTIIRRRLRQKMEFLSEDLAARAEPTDEELQAFLEDHPDAFRIEPRVTFSHIYLNRDRRGEAARQEAETILTRLGPDDEDIDAASYGDPIPLPRDYDASTQSEIANLFGQMFTARLMELEPGRWVGPIESGYGLHLVLVRERIAGRIPALAEVRKAVKRDLLAAHREDSNDELYRHLRERYSVTVEMPEWAAGDTPLVSEARR